MKVFLGGTCNNSKWRENLKPHLEIEYFDPVVKDWTPECMSEEIRQRSSCDYVLYVITKEMLGVYSIAEAVEDSNKRPDKTLFCFLPYGFDVHQLKSLKQVSKLIEDNGGKTFKDLYEIADYLNSKL